MLFQRCESKRNVENEIKSDVGFSTMHNVDTTSVPDVYTTSRQRYTASKKRCTTLVHINVSNSGTHCNTKGW